MKIYFPSRYQAVNVAEIERLNDQRLMLINQFEYMAEEKGEEEYKTEETKYLKKHKPTLLDNSIESVTMKNEMNYQKLLLKMQMEFSSSISEMTPVKKFYAALEMLEEKAKVTPKRNGR